MLNERQKRFVEEYLLDLNATQAATRAGYSAKTANEQGARLLANVSVSEAIKTALAARSERVQVNADWVLRRLAEEAEADMADLYDENGNLKPVKDWPLIWRKGLVSGVETVREKTQDGEGSMIDKIKISDRIRRLELIGKHIGVQAFKDRVEHDVSDDLAELLGKARERAIANNG